MPAQIVSIGYERRSIDELVQILASHKIEKLVDIREAPYSRRKDFSQKVLALRLAQEGIRYQHIVSAGNPHRKEKIDIQRCLRLYASYLRRNPHVVERVATELKDEPVAVLCYERQHKNCHRSILLEVLRQRGYRINLITVE